MLNSRLRIIVSGLIAQYPMPGVTWDYIQYALGLKRIGHDVYYLEDTGQWPYSPEKSGVSANCAYNVRHLSEVMARFALEDRWAYRFPWESEWYGLSAKKRQQVVDTADLIINVSGTLAHLDEYRRIPVLAYIDTDPVFTQVKLARGQPDFQNYIDTHDVHFSFGEALPGNVPASVYQWRPTRQPIVLSEWESGESAGKSYTTVMNWSSYNDVEYDGITYGQKDVEFRKFIELPSLLPDSEFVMAVGHGKNRHPPMSLLRHKGWQLIDPESTFTVIDDYRSFIASSRAEWSVAKNGYVIGQAGWFSCRSACYLAAGRPVIVQDTGFSTILPTGEGLFAFSTMDEAVAAIETVESDYERHCIGAREIAEEYFDSRKVLSQLVENGFSQSGLKSKPIGQNT